MNIENIVSLPQTIEVTEQKIIALINDYYFGSNFPKGKRHSK